MIIHLTYIHGMHIHTYIHVYVATYIILHTCMVHITYIHVLQVLYYCCQVVARVNRLSKRLPVLCKIAARHVYQSIGVHMYYAVFNV